MSRTLDRRRFFLSEVGADPQPVAASAAGINRLRCFLPSCASAAHPSADPLPTSDTFRKRSSSAGDGAAPARLPKSSPWRNRCLGLPAVRSALLWALCARVGSASTLAVLGEALHPAVGGVDAGLRVWQCNGLRSRGGRRLAPRSSTHSAVAVVSAGGSSPWQQRSLAPDLRGHRLRHRRGRRGRCSDHRGISTLMAISSGRACRSFVLPLLETQEKDEHIALRLPKAAGAAAVGLFSL